MSTLHEFAIYVKQRSEPIHAIGRGPVGCVWIPESRTFQIMDLERPIGQFTDVSGWTEEKIWTVPNDPEEKPLTTWGGQPWRTEEMDDVQFPSNQSVTVQYDARNGGMRTGQIYRDDVSPEEWEILTQVQITNEKWREAFQGKRDVEIETSDGDVARGQLVRVI